MNVPNASLLKALRSLHKGHALHYDTHSVLENTGKTECIWEWLDKLMSILSCSNEKQPLSFSIGWLIFKRQSLYKALREKYMHQFKENMLPLTSFWMCWINIKGSKQWQEGERQCQKEVARKKTHWDSWAVMSVYLMPHWEWSFFPPYEENPHNECSNLDGFHPPHNSVVNCSVTHTARFPEQSSEPASQQVKAARGCHHRHGCSEAHLH